jgi:hypothetical protein
MATAAARSIPEALKVAFDYDTEPSIGDLVEITGSRKIQKLTLAGRHLKVGEVVAVRSALTEATVVTPFRANRINRLAGETVIAGPFVFGVDNKVYQYSTGTYATHTGTNASTFNIGSSSKVVGVKIAGGAVQSITLTEDAAATIAEVVTEINDAAVGFTATATSANKLCLTADGIGQTMEITAESNSANTILGLTAAIYTSLASSHDPCLIAGLVVVGGAAAAAVETLEY